MERRIAIGGAAGFLGSYLSAWFLARGFHVVALARRRADRDVKSRVRQAVATVSDFGALELDRLEVLPFDLNGGAPSDEVVAALAGLPFVNTIASLKHGEQHRAEILATNVEGTRQLLELLGRAGARRLYHVSTAYVSGAALGDIAETRVDPETARFNNLYEQSKAEAEALILGQETLPADIVRPSIIVGSAKSGWAMNYTGYYGLLGAVRAAAIEATAAFGGHPIRYLPLRLPGDPAASSDIVPVDFVAQAIGRIVEQDCGLPHPLPGQIIHLVNTRRRLNAFYLEQVQAHLGISGATFVLPELLAGPSALERWCAARMRFNSSYTVREFRFLAQALSARLGPQTPVCPEMDAPILERVNAFYTRDTAQAAASVPARDSGRMAALACGLTALPGFLARNRIEPGPGTRDVAPPVVAPAAP